MCVTSHELSILVIVIRTEQLQVKNLQNEYPEECILLRQKNQAPSFKLRAQPWLEVELVMGSQPSILATAIDLLRKLCVNEA